MPSSSEEEPSEELFDEFLESRGHEVSERDWETDYNKKQCPACGGIHGTGATECTSCGWEPVLRSE